MQNHTKKSNNKREQEQKQSELEFTQNKINFMKQS